MIPDSIPFAALAFSILGSCVSWGRYKTTSSSTTTEEDMK